jgi:hypothetical protein
MLPGQGYYDLLANFHEWLRPKNYFEIGVNTGSSIALAKSPTVVVGVDPNPRLLKSPKTFHKIFSLTSDEYFATRDVCRDLEAETVDFEFIDGLHLFEQVVRDFINIERVSNPNTLVLIHDTFAIDTLTANRRRSTWFWTGDVWKIIPCLSELRPDLEVFTIATPPSGLSVVSNLDCHSTMLLDHFDEIVSRYVSLEFEQDEAKRRDSAAMIPNNWFAIKARLEIARSRRSQIVRMNQQAPEERSRNMSAGYEEQR